ncbi:hypothetical protein TNCV_1960411 [Trichonephila clavipes]|nr:hypothetical protein TNCV_1960411 [Trichonephila clavipes]
MLLNGSTSILPNSPLQPSVTSITYGPWYTTFATSLILDGPILPCTESPAVTPLTPGIRILHFAEIQKPIKFIRRSLSATASATQNLESEDSVNSWRSRCPEKAPLQFRENPFKLQGLATSTLLTLAAPICAKGIQHKGSITRSFLPIERLDKQSSVSRETRKGVVTSKIFSEIARTCNALGVREEQPMAFMETQCPIWTTDPSYVNLDMYRWEEFCY